MTRTLKNSAFAVFSALCVLMILRIYLWFLTIVLYGAKKSCQIQIRKDLALS